MSNNVEIGLWAVNVTEYVDNDNGKTRTVNLPYLVKASDPKHAIKIVEDENKGNGNRWKISSIRKSKVVDVLNYSGVTDLSRNPENDISLMVNS